MKFDPSVSVQKQGEPAVSEVKSVTKEDVEYVKSVFEDGVLQMKNGKWELAVSSFNKAIKKYQKNPMFFIKRAKCYLKLKKPKEAESDCSAALAIDPKILKAKFYRSKAREMSNNLRGACLDLQDIVILDPANQTAKSALDTLKPIYMASIGYDVCELFPEESTTKEIGVLDVLTGKDNASLEAELEEKIQRANVEKERGNKLVKAEKWDEAREAYSKAIMIYPDDAIFYANRAWCHMNTNNAERAVLDCSMALKKNPRYAKAYLRRAAARKETGDLWGARDDCKHLISLEPHNNQAKKELEQLNILIEKTASRDNILAAGDQKKEGFRYIFPIDKPPHLRSKKPLKRIPIKFIGANDNKKVPLPEKKNIINDLPEWVNQPGNLTPSIDKPTYNSPPQLGTTKDAWQGQMGGPQIDLELAAKDVSQESVVPSCNGVASKDFTYVFPINKKPHLRSKKPLIRVPIVFVQ